MMCVVLFTLAISIVKVNSDTFPSLISTNATIAVVLDREYLGEDYERIREEIEQYLVKAKRENLKHGGVNVNYYSWTAINVRRDFTAILSVASCSDTWRLFQSAVGESLLHLAISESDCPRLPPNEAITIPLIKKGEEMPQLLLDFRTSKTFRWSSAVILYDSIVNVDMISRVIQTLTQRYNHESEAAGISLIKLETNGTSTKDTIKDVLSNINTKTLGRNFLVIVSFESIEIVMEYAKQFNLVNTKNQWLYVIADTNHNHSDISRFKRLLKEGDNVAFAYNTTITNSKCLGGRICHSKEVLEAFTKALDEAIVDEFEMAGQVSDEEWEAIRPTKMERRGILLGKVKEYLLSNGVCDSCINWKMVTGETWGREYQVNQTSGAELLVVGSWRPTDGPSMSDELFPHIAHGFRRKNLPIITFHNPPWQILKLNESGEVVEYSGLVFDIIKELANNLNFTYTVEISKHHHFQESSNLTTTFLNEDESITNRIPSNVIDKVVNKSVVLAACAFTVTEEYMHFINYTNPISTQTYTFLVARPRELSRALLFISPFTGDTWLCLTAGIISMGPILYYIHRLSPVYQYKGIRVKGGLSTIQNCIWYMYGALLQQGGMHLPYADSARIIVGAWWLVVLVVVTTYSGNLVAFLTFPKIDIPITTITELINHKDTVTWSIVKGSYIENQLESSPEYRYQELYHGRSDRVRDKHMIKMIEEGKHVFIDWKIRLQYIMKQQYLETDRCDLALGQEEFFDERLALIMAQDTPYLTTINDEIKKLHQVGLIQKWLKDYLPKKDKCWKNRHIIEVNNHTVNMDDMQGSFFVLFLGFILSLIIIIGEKLLHRYKRKKQQAVQPFTS